MKLIIDVEKDYYEMIKHNVEHGQEYKPFEIIANGIPYEELSHEQEGIIEELENICINNEYVLDLLAKLKNKETPEGNLIQSLTELCNNYCKNCPCIGESDDCTDCLIVHIRGIMDGYIYEAIDHIEEAVRNGKPYEERPQGKWARHDEWVGGNYVGGFYHVNCPCEDGYYSKWETKFCPNCGLPMKKGGAEE